MRKKEKPASKKLFSFKENFELWGKKVGGDSFASVKRFEKLKLKEKLQRIESPKISKPTPRILWISLNLEPFRD